MSELAQHLRLALRVFSRQPGFAAITVLTLALGMGATTTIFSLVYGIAWQPLDFDEPDRIVRLWPEGRFTKAQFVHLQQHAGSYESLMAFYPRGYVVRDDDHSLILDGPNVTAGFFDVLRGQAGQGRTFVAGDDRRGADPVVISHGLWQSRFGGDPEVVGRPLVVDDLRRTVVGVMPEGFDFLQRGAHFAVPLFMDPDESDFSGFTILQAVGRLKPEVGTAAAQAKLRSLMSALRAELDLPDDWGANATVVPLREAIVGNARTHLRLIFGAVASLLAIATVNVASLLLARTLAQMPETSLRVALGATPGRLVRQRLTESTLLGLAGGLLGFLVAGAGLQGILSILPRDTPRLDEIRPSVEVFAFSLSMALAAGWLVGLLPALQSARASLPLGSVRATASGGRRRLRSALVVAEVAMAVALLIGAGLMVESFRRILAEDPGFEAEGLIVLHLGSERGFVETPAEAEDYYDRMSERLRVLPGVESVATVLRVPFYDGGWSLTVYPTGQAPTEGVTPPVAYWRPVDPDYFATAGIRMIAGRGFDRTLDLEDSEPVVVLNETTAQRLFPEGDVLGKRVTFPYEPPLDLTVVGVAEDVKLNGLTQAAPLIVYRPFSQELVHLLKEMNVFWRMIVLRTGLASGRGEASPLYGPVQQAVREVDPNAPIRNFLPLTAVIGDTLAANRVITVALTLLAATALFLGAIGIYGVMGYTVNEQIREMGVRLALGASSRRVIGGVLENGLKISGLGIVVGILLALGLTRFLASLVYGISTREPSVFAAVAVALVVVALLATFVPAWRAGRVDPIRVLKEE